MQHYSTTDSDDAQEFVPSITEAEFNEGLDAFFSGGPLPRRSGEALNIGGTGFTTKDEAALAEFDALCSDAASPAATAVSEQMQLDEQKQLDEPTWERIDDIVRPTRYDRAFSALREAEAERDAAEPDSAAYHLAMSKHADAKHRLRIETERDMDEGWRERRRFDEWRAGAGREERNASRRKVRSEPNARLIDMTPDERTAHERTRDADQKWMNRKRKAG